LSWTDVSGNLPDLPAYTLAIDPRTSTWYVGTDDGVYISADQGTSWSRFGAGLPHSQVRDLELQTGLGILAAGTHGRGLWEILLPRLGGDLGGAGPAGAVVPAMFAGLAAAAALLPGGPAEPVSRVAAGQQSAAAPVATGTALTGQATLDGTLAVNLINGSVPGSGDRFTVPTFGWGTGAFPAIGGEGSLFNLGFDSTDGTLVAN